jgi:predicted HAD superfamily Cof-like phosphohydrolase
MITNNKLEFIVSDCVFDDVRDMHEKFGVEPSDLFDAQQWPIQKLFGLLEFRLNQQAEETAELTLAIQSFLAAPNAEVAKEQAEHIVDALVDGIVFAVGTLDLFNLCGQSAWDRVHEANMRKRPGVNPQRPNPFGFPDLIKPEGWKAPTHEESVDFSILEHMIEMRFPAVEVTSEASPQP